MGVAKIEGMYSSGRGVQVIELVTCEVAVIALHFPAGYMVTGGPYSEWGSVLAGWINRGKR